MTIIKVILLLIQLRKRIQINKQINNLYNCVSYVHLTIYKKIDLYFYKLFNTHNDDYCSNSDEFSNH
jgi:hypothetical protein